MISSSNLGSHYNLRSIIRVAEPIANDIENTPVTGLVASKIVSPISANKRVHSTDNLKGGGIHSSLIICKPLSTTFNVGCIRDVLHNIIKAFRLT